MDWLFLIEIVLSGLGSGALLALTGIAFVLIYKATKVLNLAVGEMLMLCAYFFFGLTAALALPVWLAIILTVIGGGILGGVIERVFDPADAGREPHLGVHGDSRPQLCSDRVRRIRLGSDPATLPNFLPSKPIFIGSAYVSRRLR